MHYDQMMGGGMWGMWLFGLLILALVVLGIAALIKYLGR
ncbi:putative membrane protein [Xanthobacter flavus]|nr:putative membrane protein [Xanthobacter flavus]